VRFLSRLVCLTTRLQNARRSFVPLLLVEIKVRLPNHKIARRI
jgi:hypothetical protein